MLVYTINKDDLQTYDLTSSIVHGVDSSSSQEDVEEAVENLARYIYYERDGWDLEWPITICLWHGEGTTVESMKPFRSFKIDIETNPDFIVLSNEPYNATAST